MIDHESRIDIGVQAQLWGQPKSQPTCLAPNTTIPTRRDYVIANKEALRLISGFEVIDQLDFPVHSFLKLTFTVSKVKRVINRDIRPANMTTVFDAHCASCTAEDMDDKAKSTIRQAQLARYHKALDLKLAKSKALFQQLLSASNINGYWQLWNSAVEDSFCEIFVAKARRRRVKGRGHTNIKPQEECKFNAYRFNDEADTEATLVDARLASINKQAVRCKQWDSRLQCTRKQSGSLPERLMSTYRRLNTEAANLIHRDLDMENPFEADLADKIHSLDGSHPAHLV
jgi:hypothetical protein